MIRYKGALYDNIWLVNGFKERDTAYGHATSVENVEELQTVIFKAVYNDPNFRENDKNVFELTNKLWNLKITRT